jgi:hypothetical protein
MSCRSFPSQGWIAALILALAATACSTQSPPATSAKVVKAAPAPAPTATAAPKAAPVPATPTGSAGKEKKPGQSFTEGELAALLAPIALYPDNVVAQILMASTYPVEIIEAHRWLQKNKQLKGDELAAAAQKQDWEDSVKSLVAAPEVLKMMDENLAWMQKIGDAFLSQQKDVFDMVQTLRARAMKEGTLKSDEHLKVSMVDAPAEDDDAEAEAAMKEKPPQIIAIESADPEVIYVPTYSPVSMYGSWDYWYPPYYWPPPYGYPGYGLWWGMGAGIVVGGIWGDCCWGGGDVNIDWDGGDINIGDGDRGNRGDHIEHNRGEGGRGDRAGQGDRGGKWSHQPEHRKGASYRDNATAERFNRGSAGTARSRESFRGRSGTSGSGSRPAAGTRPSTGTGGTGNRGGRSGTSTGSGSRGGSSGAFGGMGSGSRAGSYGSRGGMSRGGGGGMRGGGGGGRRR